MLSHCAYYETESTSAPFNLAVEEVLVESMEAEAPGCFMLWQNGPSVIVGRHQNTRSEVNLPELKKRGIDLVRRLTGGGAVYHDLGNINFTFILPRGHGKEPETRELLQPLVNYLDGFGIKAGMEGRNDLSIPGRGKFSGLAGRRLPGKFLLHGTLLYDVDVSVLEQVLLVDPEKYRSKGVASVRARVTNLKPLLPVSLKELWEGIRNAYGAQISPLPKEIREKANALAMVRYACPDWNIGESPPGDIVLKRRFPFGSLELRLATHKESISSALLTGDFLSPDYGTEISATQLSDALVGLPANKPQEWAAAWQKFPMDRIFYGYAGPEEITLWLATAHEPENGSAVYK